MVPFGNGDRGLLPDATPCPSATTPAMPMSLTVEESDVLTDKIVATYPAPRNRQLSSAAETAEGAEMNGVNGLTNEILGAAIEVHRP